MSVPGVRVAAVTTVTLSIVRSPLPPVTDTSMSQTKALAEVTRRAHVAAVPAPPPVAATAGIAFSVPTAPDVEAKSAPVTVKVASGVGVVAPLAGRVPEQSRILAFEPAADPIAVRIVEAMLLRRDVANEIIEVP